MTESARELLKKALSLAVEDRASIAGALIESLEQDRDSDAEAAWDAEIERRVNQLESRNFATVPWAAVRERLFQGFD